MNVVFCGYFTRETPYEAEAVQCIASLDRFGLAHDFIGVPNLGDWARNCAQKPQVIRRMMQKHDGTPLVYIDVDARVRQKPVLFSLMPAEIDIACHYRHGVEVLSGTLYIGTTAAARRLVDTWCELCERDPNEWDQRHLQSLTDSGLYNVYRLPSEMCRIFDDPKMGEPVIEHMQASRRYSEEVKACSRSHST